MYIQITFDLTLGVDSKMFSKLLNKAKSNGCCKQSRYDDEKTVDSALASKGIIVTYRNSQYKKKVRLTVSPDVMLNGELDFDNSSELIRKLEKRIVKYFDHKYTLNDFTLNEISLTTNIDVGSREKVSDYLKALHNIRQVKFFSPIKHSRHGRIAKDGLFGLQGNTNGVEFRAYRAKDDYNVLQVEVRLAKKETIRAYADKSSAVKQIQYIVENSEHIFMDTFKHIIPRGDFYKKQKAEKLIWERVPEAKYRYRMLRLLQLVPEKKSLHLAQKALDYRNIGDLMAKFAEINVSPITISKRHNIKKLDSLYSYFE